LKSHDESLLSEVDLKNQKDHAEHGACFLFAGRKLRVSEARLAGTNTPACDGNSICRTEAKGE